MVIKLTFQLGLTHLYFLFLESPGKDWGFYSEESKFPKRPTFQWYWVHKGITDLSLESNTKLRKYGEFFASIINCFRLSNVYVTNLVKCGLAIHNKPEFSIRNYDEEVVDNCLKEYFSKELEIIVPQVVFAFGWRAYNKFKEKYSDKYIEGENLFYMPHPAMRSISQIKYR